jgi:hypothetical protein
MSGNATNRELASSPAQNEAFRRTAEVARGPVVGQGQQLTGTLRCLRLQVVGLASVLMSAGREWLALEDARVAQIVPVFVFCRNPLCWLR